MNHNVLAIRESITKIVSMLALKNVKVQQRGMKAYVRYNGKGEPAIVNLPYIPDNASEELIGAVQGFLDHEVAHILFTDYAALEKAKEVKAQNMHNLVEDIFIEKRMTHEFKGSGLNLANVGRFFTKNITDKKILEEPEKTIPYLMMPALRALAGQAVYRDYMEDKWGIVETEIKKLGPDITDLLCSPTNSFECVDVALEIKKRLGTSEDLPTDPGDGDGEESGDEEGEESGKGKKGKKDDKKKDKKDKKDKKKEPKEKEEDDSSEEGDGDGSSADEEGDGDEKEGDEEGDGTDEGGEGGEDEGSGDEDEGTAPSPDKGEGDADAPDEFTPSGKSSEPTKTEEAAGPSAEDIEKDLGSFDDGLSEALEKLATEEAASSPYLIYTTDCDVIEKMEGLDPEGTRTMMNNVDHMVGPIQKGLERAMAAISAVAWTAGHRSGRLHSGSLHRLTLGDDRVFKRKHEAQSKDVAVSLVVDLSGSMIGQKQELAGYAAYALSSVLDRMKINHEVIGFTSKPFDRETYVAMRDESRTTGISYARLEALYMPILKGWDERMNAEVRQRLSYIADKFGALRENVDGECVQIAAYRLRQRKENRKVMIVLSDGNPACSGDSVVLHQHLKKVVPEIEKSGIEVIGIGIKSKAVANFYKKHVILDEIEGLPGEVLNQLKKLLIRK